MKNKAVTKKILMVSLLLAAALFLSACSLVVKDPEVDARQVIVSVNGEEVAKERFTQYFINAYNQEYATQQYYQQLGMVQQISVNRDKVLKNTADAVVRDLALRQKGKELGLDALTPEEEGKAKEAADKSYQDLLDQVKTQFFPETELAGEELDKALRDKAAEYDITPERLMEDERVRVLYDKLKEHVTRDVAVSDEEVKAEFDKKVEQDKASYETNPTGYGSAVNAGRPVYSAPAGYRFVKQILVKFSQEDQDAIKALEQELAPLTTALDEAQAAADQYRVTHQEEEAGEKKDEAEKDVQPAQDDPELLALESALSEARANHDAKSAELEARKAAAYAAILPRANEAYAKAVAEGADFDALIKEYNDDAGQPARGYAVCKDFTGFDEAFLKPAMALEKIGGVAEPSPGIYGYYIVQYAADIPEGPVALDSVKDSLHEALLTAKKDQTFIEAGDAWVAEADVKTYVERMKD